MNDTPERQPSLSDHQVDDLLSAFYLSEIPANLDQPPSTWPEIAETTAETDEPVAAPYPVRHSSSAGRGFAVAITTVAACLMVIVFSQSAPDNDSADNTADTTTDAPLDNAGTINVSGDGGTGSGQSAARDDDTSWDEVLNSEAPKTLPNGKTNKKTDGDDSRSDEN